MAKAEYALTSRSGAAGAFVCLLAGLLLLAACEEDKTPEKPLTAVRVQVLTVDAGAESAAEIGKWLEAQADSSFAIDVVEANRYELRSAARTLIVSRVEDETAARRLANRIGLDPSEVIYKPLEHNTKQATVTLIVGSDFDRIVSSQQITKELQK